MTQGLHAVIKGIFQGAVSYHIRVVYTGSWQVRKRRSCNVRLLWLQPALSSPLLMQQTPVQVCDLHAMCRFAIGAHLCAADLCL